MIASRVTWSSLVQFGSIWFINGRQENHYGQLVVELLSFTGVYFLQKVFSASGTAYAKSCFESSPTSC